MASPSSSSQRNNTHLSDFAQGYMQDPAKFVALNIAKQVKVEIKSGSYFVYDKGDFLRRRAQKRERFQESAGGGYALSDDTYTCEKSSWHHDIDWDDEYDQAEPLDAQEDGAIICGHAMALEIEELFVAACFSAGKWATDVTGTASTNDADECVYWSAAGGTPVDEVLKRCNEIDASTGFRPNTLVLGPGAERGLYSAPDITGRMGTNGPQTPSNADLAAMMKLDNVFTARGVHVDTNPGQADVGSHIYGRSALLLYVPKGEKVTKRQPAACKTFVFAPYSGDNGVRVDAFDIRERNLTRVEGDIFLQTKITGTDLGCFFSNIVPA